VSSNKNTTELVQKLRTISGAGILECKKVLEETDNDIEKSLVLLRERGATKAMNKSMRVAKKWYNNILHPCRRKIRCYVRT